MVTRVLPDDDTEETTMPDVNDPDPESIDEIADGDDVPPSEEEITQDPAPYEEDTV